MNGLGAQTAVATRGVDARRPEGPSAYAHPTWLRRAAGASASEDAVMRVAATPRTAARFDALISERMGLSRTVVDWTIEGRATLVGPWRLVAARVLLLGALANGRPIRQSVARLSVKALVGALGEPILRAAVRAGEAEADGRASSEERAPIDPSGGAAFVRARMARSGARHLAAWLTTQPEAVRQRALLALPPDGELTPRDPALGDPDFLPRVETALLRLDPEEA